jgi:hypothetical protein
MTNDEKRCEISQLNDRLMVQYVRNSVVYASEDHFVLKSCDHGATWETVCRLETRDTSVFGRTKDAVLRNGFVKKIRRNIGIHNVVVLPSGTVLIQYNGVYRYDGEGTIAKRVFGFRSKKIIGPIKNGFVADDRTGHVYWGEYNISRPYAVRIFRGTDDGRKWEECYRFPLGRIRHVHSIIPDVYRNRLWICTGDSDSETGLFYTEDDFQSVKEFKGGDQSWRMVSMIPREHYLYWGSDAGQDAPPDTLNYIYRWDFKKNKKERLELIDKPAYYATVLRDGTMAMGVHHEPKILRDVDPGADLWISRTGERWEKILSLPYLPANRKMGTKYASLCLPLGDGTAEFVYTTPLNVQKDDFKTIKVTII